MKTYYLYTEPYTVYSCKGNKILLYNCLDKQSTITTVDKELERIIEGLNREKFIVLTEEDIQKETVRNFVRLLQVSYNGDILPAGEKQIPPALFHPIVNNQRDFDRLLKVDKINIDNQVMNYLEEVYLYLNGVEEGSEYPPFRQVPSYMNQEGDIDADKIIKWLESIHNKQMNQLNLLGGDVLQHPHFKEIMEVAKSKTHEVKLYYRYDLFKSSYLQQLQSYDIDQLFIVVPMQAVNNTLLEQRTDEMKDFSSFIIQWIFLISSEEEYMQADKFITRHHIDNYQIKPLFNGKNLNFFENEVFLTQEEILSLKPEKREIFANQKINRNDFGRITVLPDGSIFANTNNSSLGTIEKDRMHDIIYHEMNDGCSWLNIRRQPPCSNCIFQWLCPSPSNYESVIGKPNLCHVKP